MKPTQEAYGELVQAYDYFNGELFGGTLPPCLITLQHKKRTYGYYSRGRFVHRGGRKTDEIAMNPAYFAVTSVEDVLSTLVHEMVHLWQHHKGKAGRRGYHNAEFAEKMKAIGLQPSSTGLPGGKETGEKMDHFILPDAPFILAARKLLTRGWALSWLDRYPEATRSGGGGGGASVAEGVPMLPVATSPSPLEAAEDLDVVLEAGEAADRSNRRKYRCGSCDVNAWGKPGLHLICGKCRQDMRDTAAPSGAAPG
ncbi:TPA: SprT-like domain-containing protein [Pseudomonas aeruginosa]|nr:SprT-like domain-containing protein [Pseudomonas aeruginosa]